MNCGIVVSLTDLTGLDGRLIRPNLLDMHDENETITVPCGGCLCVPLSNVEYVEL